jgi:hypothetical protein
MTADQRWVSARTTMLERCFNKAALRTLSFMAQGRQHTNAMSNDMVDCGTNFIWWLHTQRCGYAGTDVPYRLLSRVWVHRKPEFLDQRNQTRTLAHGTQAVSVCVPGAWRSSWCSATQAILCTTFSEYPTSKSRLAAQRLVFAQDGIKIRMSHSATHDTGPFMSVHPRRTLASALRTSGE